MNMNLFLIVGHFAALDWQTQALGTLQRTASR